MIGKKVVEAFTHRQRVRLLYKTVLKLHRGLPTELQGLGNQYARDEFKRHKEATAEQGQIFMVEWTNYAINLAKQLGIRGTHMAQSLGNHLKETDLDNFNAEQIHQLFELYEAASAPRPETTDS